MTASDFTPLVIPFVGERFADSNRLSGLIAPPYDVISTEQRAVLAARDPHNIVQLILPEGNDDAYEHARLTLQDWRENGVLVRDVEDSVYVVQQHFKTPHHEDRIRTGVIGAVAVEPFAAGRIRPHERTHAAPKADRLALLSSTRTMFEALFMLARDEDGSLQSQLNAAVAEQPDGNATLGDVSIQVWQVRGADAHAIAEAVGAGPLYMADGHHRYETAIAYRVQNPRASRTLAMVVPLSDPGLTVLATHRLIYGKAVSIGDLIERSRGRFHVHELPSNVSYAEHLAGLRDRGTACIVLGHGESAVALLLKAGAKLGDLSFADQPAVGALDVARVDELIVDALLEAAGEGAHIGYSPDANRVIDEVLAGHAVAGVLLNPASVDQVLAVADAGAVMPQKATYFTPKVPSGLVMMRVDES